MEEGVEFGYQGVNGGYGSGRGWVVVGVGVNSREDAEVEEG